MTRKQSCSYCFHFFSVLPGGPQLSIPPPHFRPASLHGEQPAALAGCHSCSPSWSGKLYGEWEFRETFVHIASSHPSAAPAPLVAASTACPVLVPSLPCAHAPSPRRRETRRHQVSSREPVARSPSPAPSIPSPNKTNLPTPPSPFHSPTIPPFPSPQLPAPIPAPASPVPIPVPAPTSPAPLPSIPPIRFEQFCSDNKRSHPRHSGAFCARVH